MAESTLHPPGSPAAVHRGPTRRILVAYATKRGSTREVAETIATTLQEQGQRVDLRAAADCRDLREYRAVVLGGALYMGRWHKDARARSSGDTRPRSTSGRSPCSRWGQAALRGARQQLDRTLKRASGLDPVAVAIFGGVIDPAKLRFPFNRMPAGDARDWDAIRAWATELPGRLAGRGLPADGPAER